MSFDGRTLKRFHDVLIIAFPSRDHLAQLVRFRLDVRLETIANAENQSTVIFKLLEWAESKNKLEALLKEASEENPDNQELRAFAEELLGRKAVPKRPRRKSSENTRKSRDSLPASIKPTKQSTPLTPASVPAPTRDEHEQQVTEQVTACPTPVTQSVTLPASDFPAASRSTRRQSEKVVGIDLGTTRSAIAVMMGDWGDYRVIPNEEGELLTPSVVAWVSKNNVLVGESAKRQAAMNPKNTVYSAKRFIGRKLYEVSEEADLVPYKVVAARNDDAAFDVQGSEFMPADVSCYVLGKLKKAAEAFLDEIVTDAVITVPAYFNDCQRRATEAAGKQAGFNVRRILNEPTAAALAYGLTKKKGQLIAVYDFGGGTFDISIVEVGENVVEVKSTSGDTRLGGGDIDCRITEYLIAEFRRDYGVNLKNDKVALHRVREAAEWAKIELSLRQEITVNLPCITGLRQTSLHMDIRLTRSKFEEMISDLVERTIDTTRHALFLAGKNPSDIHEVVLVGGSTRIPLVQRRVRNLFGKEPNRSVNPDEVVAIGAAVQGSIIADKLNDMLLLEMTPLSWSIETKGGISSVIIPRNTLIPTQRSESFSTVSDNQTQVEVHVLQGESLIASENKSLGRFILDGIDPAPQGVPKIRVTFDINASGILMVTAQDEVTGRRQRVIVNT